MISHDVGEDVLDFFSDIYYYKKIRIQQNDVLSLLVGVEYLYIY